MTKVDREEMTMELKRKLRLTLELCLVMSVLPLLLLGCGGGGGAGTAAATPAATTPASTAGLMQGQYWTDLMGVGIRRFFQGIPANGVIDTANFSGGNYIVTRVVKTLSGGVWGINTDKTYVLTPSGWVLFPASSVIAAANATTYTSTDVAGILSSSVITTVNLSGTPVVASSAVPAITALGYASAVSPASAVYPAGSYEYDLSNTVTAATPGYWFSVIPATAVTTVAGSATPINQTNFTTAGFAAHATTADPICLTGLGFVHKIGVTYDAYGLTLNAGVPAMTMGTCQNASIVGGAVSSGTIDLTFVTVNGAPIVTFSNGTGIFVGGTAYGAYIASLFLGLSPAVGAAYYGNVFPAGTTTSSSFWLNKTAMDAALQAWGAPTY